MADIHSWAWRRLKDQVVQEEPQCWLRLPGCTGASTTADHVIPRSQRPDLTMVRSNLRGACHKCNTTRGNKTGRALDEAKRKGQPPRALKFFD